MFINIKNMFISCKMLISKFPYYILLKIYSIISSIILSLIPVKLVELLVSTYEAGESFNSCLIYIMIAFGILFIFAVADFFYNVAMDKINRFFIGKQQIMFFNKLKDIDYDFMESPAFLNDYTRSLEESSDYIYNTADGTFNIIKTILTSVSVFIEIASIGIPFIIVILAVGLAIVYLILRYLMSILNYKNHSEARPYRRIMRYNERAFTLKESMPEIKTTNIDTILLENNDEAHQNVVRIFDKYIPPRSALNLLSNLLLTLIYPAIILVIAYQSKVSNTFDIAAISSMTVAATTISYLITDLTGSLSNVQQSVVECKVPFELLKTYGSIEGVKGKEIDGEFKSITASNLVFSYTGVRNQIDDVSFTINKGERIAIVGVNGAGKTTIVKLLLRLYDVKSGTLKINDIPYKDVSVMSLRKKVGAVFQNVEEYALTIAENVLLRTPQNEDDINLVNEALKFSGLYDYVYSLPLNINTVLTREFRHIGEVFSGGQKQKLAIARGYAAGYELFILDEPSSALDPIAEAEVYNNLLTLGKDKTIIFISHRLTTTVNADKIFLFDGGKIIEAGRHEELLKLNGVYAKMFKSQSSKYIGGEEDA